MNRQTILTVVLIGIMLALGALWYFYLSGLPEEHKGEVSGVDIDAYERIKTLRLDVALLNDPVFQALKQETIPPPATESVGRSNPFLPF